MDTEEGLFVPVLRNVGERDASDLRRGLEAMKTDVVNRSVPLEELRGQTITLSNFGMFGGRHAALVVLPPQVAILGAGRIQDRVMAIDGEPLVRPVLPLSLTFDHRAVMGGEATPAQGREVRGGGVQSSESAFVGNPGIREASKAPKRAAKIREELGAKELQSRRRAFLLEQNLDHRHGLAVQFLGLCVLTEASGAKAHRVDHCCVTFLSLEVESA